MRFDFEAFPGKGRGFAARASIRRNSQLGFNSGAVDRHKLRQYDGALLYYDRKNRVIGVQFVTGGDDPKILKLIHRPGDSYLSAKSFLEWFELPPPAKTEKYELTKDEDAGMFIIELDRPIARKDRQARQGQQDMQL